MKTKIFNIIFISAAFLYYASLIFALDDSNLLSREREYKIQKKDILHIVIYPQNELNTEAEVGKDGNIFFSFLGNVHAEGLSADEFAENLRKILEKDYLVNPSVSVRLVKPHHGDVVIIGQVVRPGTYPYNRDDPVTLIGLISLAGGFTDIANINGTKVIRLQKDGKDKAINVKVGRILDGKQGDLMLEAGDIVIVPESFF